jgi:hypothetical protein
MTSVKNTPVGGQRARPPTELSDEQRTQAVDLIRQAIKLRAEFWEQKIALQRIIGVQSGLDTMIDYYAATPLGGPSQSDLNNFLKW